MKLIYFWQIVDAISLSRKAEVVTNLICKYELLKGTIQPGRRLVPSGNFFLALNRSHHFLLKKSQNLIRQLEHNDSILIILLYCKILRTYTKIIKFEPLCLSCLIKFWLFFTEYDYFYLKPKSVKKKPSQKWSKKSPIFLQTLLV